MSAGPERTVVVVGGGIAGLAAAWELITAGPDTRVVVLESEARPGGKLRSAPVGGRPVDLGPDAFVARRPEALALCAELGLTDELVAPGVRRAFVWARGRLRPLPAGLALGVPTRLGPLARSGICSPVGLVRPALDLLRPGLGRRPAAAAGDPAEDTAVGAVVRRRLGRQVHDRLAGPLVGGIHAGDVDAMSAAAVFPALLEAEARPGSLMRALAATLPGATVTSAADRPGPGPGAGSGSEPPAFLTLRGGLGRLADELAGALARRGVELRCGTTVRGLAPVTEGHHHGWRIDHQGTVLEADAVVVAVPAPTAGDLLREHDGALADALATIDYASVAIVTLRFTDGGIDHPLDGSGFLVPRDESGGADPLVTACTWLSSKWPELRRPGDVLLRVSVGRAGDDRHTEMGDDELVARCRAELGAMMPISGSPMETVVTRWPLAFPQYTVGHQRRVASLEGAAARLPHLALAGAALHGVGVPACIGSGRRAGRALLAGLAAAPPGARP